ncbi:MAG: DUF885 domain-containing protein [Bacteroidetes bacterium]|nr:DUF885 domain-containing protein [Bacteroidota bacterium]
MRKIFSFLIVITAIAACDTKTSDKGSVIIEPNKELASFFEQYHEDNLKLFPLSATFEGDNRYNDLLPADFTDSYRDSTKRFYERYLKELSSFDTSKLNDEDKLSYAILKYNLDVNIKGLAFHDNYIPLNQFYGMQNTLGQFAGGTGAQPFKTIEDYEKWIKRVAAFAVWADSAIVYFRKGMESGIVLPKSLVVKIIPQMKAMVTDTADYAKNLYYSPIAILPASFSDADKRTLAAAYKKMVNENIVPVFSKLSDFFQKEYLPKGRTSSGIGALPGGKEMYEYLVYQQTTTTKTPDEIYNTGLAEVKRIRGLMDSVKNAVGFKGDLPAFFEYMKTDKKFMPYKTPKEVLAAFEAIHTRMEPNLKKMFNHVPKTKFEIRQTEAFRAASASAEYSQGTADGSRPGIFYVPILDATRFNTTSGMESLFLHEAIPGHHYQISLQQEDTSLPKFRRFGGQNAYVEGWALYCESLGKELGLYTDPYQYMGALGDEIHRAIRLVVDVAIHEKGMSREDAIKYMMDNEAISEQGATAEIERYMAIPGQALGYKVGALKIRELRTKAEKELGDKFNLADFHDQVLKDGSMPLDLLEQKIDAWIKKIKG